MGYLMDTPNEGRRIELKTDRELTEQQLCWGGLKQGMKVLDLGCAAGTTCRIMAELIGQGGHVVGVDGSNDRLEEARGYHGCDSIIEYRQGDASCMPCEDAEYDLAWSRFLFEYLDDPQQALNEMVRVTKPGGVVCVSDLDGNCIWNEPCEAKLQSGLNEALETLAGSFDPRIGRRLFGMFHGAGLDNIRVDVRPYHTLFGAINTVEESHWRMKLDGVGSALRNRGWEPIKTAALTGAFLDHLRNPATATYSVLISVCGTKST